MNQRSYHQVCGIARALDVVGARWTLLIVRDLIPGPQRFTDLIQGLPGLSPHLLSTRLKALESADIVCRRELPPPAAAVVWELTDAGAGLEPVLEALVHWGARFHGEAAPEDLRRVRWALWALGAFEIAPAAASVGDIWEFRTEDGIYAVEVSQDGFDVSQAPIRQPTMRLDADSETVWDLAAGRLSLSDAEREERVEITGDRQAAKRAINTIAKLKPFVAL